MHNSVPVSSNPASVISPVQHPSSNFTPEPLPKGDTNPSSTDDTGARDSGDKGSDDKQDQAAAEHKYNFAYVHEEWKAREAKAAVDEASPRERTATIISGRSATVKKSFAMLKGMKMETEDAMYQAATTIAVALGYSEDHISIPLSKYEFLEDIASMLERQHVSPSDIDELLKYMAQRQGFYTYSTPSMYHP